jgi:hypothetical protein
MKPILSLLLAVGLAGWLLGQQSVVSRSAPAPAATDAGFALGIAKERGSRGVLAAARPMGSEATQLRLSHSGGRPKIAYSFNADDDLAAIRRAGFTHVLISYLQARPDAEQRQKLDECRRHGLKVIYRMVDLVDRDRRTGGDARMRHAVELLRDHPAVAGWQTYEETNLPPAQQVAVYRKIKGWDPDHPIIIVTTNEYSEGWYRRTYSDDAQDILMIDFYPYKRRYDGWVYIHRTVPAILAVQKRPVPIIPIIQASSATGVSSSDDTLWPPPDGLVKQLNLWWTLGADAGVALWLWRGSPEYPFVGLADGNAPPHALKETQALLKRIPDGALPWSRREASGVRREQRRPEGTPYSADASRPPTARVPAPDRWLKALRLRPLRVNHLKNSGFEAGLEGWVGYDKIAGLTGQALQGRQAARMANTGPPHAIGVGQHTDLLVPPNAAVTLSCFYKVLKETTLLQWKIGTTGEAVGSRGQGVGSDGPSPTAHSLLPTPFRAAEFLERRERLPAGDWRRAWVSVTNTTGAPQRVTGVSVSSNGFTGEVLLDNFQLELAPAPTSYTEATPGARTAATTQRRGAATAGLRYELPPGSTGTGRARRSRRQPGSGGWTLSAWSAVETPPEPGSYACLAVVEGVGSREWGVGNRERPAVPTAYSLFPTPSTRVDLRFSVDAASSDASGWVSTLAVMADGETRVAMPLALAPGQPLFWALSSTADGELTLHAAPAGYGLHSRQGAESGTRRVRTSRPLPSAVRSIYLGADAGGEHQLHGLVGGGRFVPRVLTDSEVERLRDRAP